jgi:hypothetical protein
MTCPDAQDAGVEPPHRWPVCSQVGAHNARLSVSSCALADAFMGVLWLENECQATPIQLVNAHVV